MNEGHRHPDVSYGVMVDSLKRHLNLNLEYSRDPQVSKGLQKSLEALWFEAYRRGSGASEEAFPVRDSILRIFHEEGGSLPEDLLKKLTLVWEEAVVCGRGEACNHCGSREGVAFEDSRTCYSPTEENPFPNASIPFCRECAVEHHEYWDDMWAEYYYDRL